MDIFQRFQLTNSKVLEKIIENIPDYDENFEEIDSYNFSEGEFDEEFQANIQEIISNFVKQYNNPFDNYESNVLKIALHHDESIRFISESNQVFINILDYFDINDPDKILEIFSKNTNGIIDFEDYVKAAFYKEEFQTPELLQKYRQVYKSITGGYLDDLIINKENWDIKISQWKSQEHKILEKIYAHQQALIFLNRYPGFTYKFVPRTRELDFKEVVGSDKELYDVFIFCRPSKYIPFIRFDFQDPVKAERDTKYALYSYGINYSENWKEYDEEVTAKLLNQKFKIKTDDTIHFIIDLNPENLNIGQKNFAKGIFYLDTENNSKFILKLSSDLDFSQLENKVYSAIFSCFEFTVSNPVEKSVELITTFKSKSPNIDMNLFQFYLINNPDIRVLISESKKLVGDKRKINIEQYPYEFHPDRENYNILLDVSRPQEIIVYGPTQEKAENYFKNTFSRIFQGFMVRQSNLYKALYASFSSEVTKTETKEVSRVLKFSKTKNDAIKNLFNLPEGYSRNLCACERQPVVIPVDEIDSWKNFKNSIIPSDKNFFEKREIKTFTLTDGKEVGFICPDNAFPYIRFTNKNKKKIGNQFYPCCWGEEWDDFVSVDEIVMASAIDEDVTKSEEIVVEIDDRKEDYTKIPQSLQRLLEYGDDINDKGEYKIYNIDKGPNNLLECVLYATANKDYNRINRTISKVSVLEMYREKLYKEVSPLVYSQEMYDVSTDDIVSELKSDTSELKYEYHFRGLEELFKVHIFLFTLTPRKDSPYGINEDFYMEIPRHRIAHFKTFYNDRPSVILIRGASSYNVIITDSKKIFSHQTKNLFNFFISFHKTLTSDSSYLVENMYSRTNWMDFFDNQIIEQEIDSYGKLRVLKLTNGATLSIPPSQPLNLPRICQYEKIDEESCISIFGEPDGVDNDGFWYSWLNFKNMIYVLCDHPREKTPNLITFMNSPFKGTSSVIEEIKNVNKKIKSCNALVQIIHWAWRLDSRPEISPWLDKYLRISNDYDKETILPLSIRISLPRKAKNSLMAFNWASTWWPQVFRNGKINVYRELYVKLLGFFGREAEVMTGYDKDDVPPILFRIYDTSANYPEIDNKIVFINYTNLADFMTKSISDSIQCYEKIPLSPEFYSKFSPIRIYQWGRVFILQNVSSGSFEDAVKVCYYWRKYKINIGYKLNIPVEENISTQTVSIYTVSKNNRIILYSSSEREAEIHVLLSPYDRYSAILL